MNTLTFLIVTSGYDKLTLIVYVVIFFAMVLGLFSARQKKKGTAQPIKTLIINSLICYMFILFLIEYSEMLKSLSIRLIILGSFLVGLSADNISNQVLHLSETLSIKFLFKKIFGDSKLNYEDKQKKDNEEKK